VQHPDLDVRDGDLLLVREVLVGSVVGVDLVPQGPVLTGDMLLKGGPLRVDRTLSRYPPITRSLRERVLGLPPQTRVLPGHGDETTIGDERDLPELVPPLEP
jgi:glyoxylase-like metal-dependent hydrolase (beta-lactamase superfamily II)